jgi:hypothetical protein
MTVPTGRSPGRPSGLNTQPTVDYSATGIPEAPVGLKAKGKKEWTRIWTAAKWLHREQHFMLVLNYCQKIDELAGWQTELSVMKKISEKNYGTALSVYQASNGSWAPYPQVTLIKESRAQLTAWLIEMKLSPSHLPDASGEDDGMKERRKQNRGV